MANQSPYAETTLAKTLRESLNELVQKQRIRPQLAQRVGAQLDKSVTAALARVRSRFKFRGRVMSYKFKKDRWKVFMENVEFKDVAMANLVYVSNLKIIASKPSKSEATP